MYDMLQIHIERLNLAPLLECSVSPLAASRVVNSKGKVGIVTPVVRICTFIAWICKMSTFIFAFLLMLVVKLGVLNFS